MSLMEDIKKTIEETKTESKKDKLLGVRNEIQLMIDEKIPLTKQINLLVKNGILESIDIKYYRSILKSEFDYKKSKNSTLRKEVGRPTKMVRKEEKKQVQETKKTATEMLSQSIELKF